MVYDLVIRGGTVIDGTGSAARSADVAIADGRIVEVGRVSGRAARNLDADGLVVTPGWVDIHTHYDGQVYWDPLLTPSSWNGVTTVVVGNCGVGIAPARPDMHTFLIELMAKIEDIPVPTLNAGIPWGWETFTEYMDCLDGASTAVDVGVLIAHGAVRTYVMGERSVEEMATDDEIEEICSIVAEGMRAGALGCSTNHMTAKGAIVPGTFASDEEFLAVAKVAGEAGGLLQTSLAGLFGDQPPERGRSDIELARRMSVAGGGCPMTFGIVQYEGDPDFWRTILGWITEANQNGSDIFAQVLGRPLNILVSLSTRNPYERTPTFKEISQRPLPELVALMRRDDVRSRILQETAELERTMPVFRQFPMDTVFHLEDPPDYEPSPEKSIAALTRDDDRPVAEIFYDMLLQDEGRATFLCMKMNYAARNGDVICEMIQHPLTVLGLGDGGAHGLSICDASTQTTVITQWARDRTRGPRIPLERAVHEITMNTARHFGLHDRGALLPGMKADVNAIDMDNLQLGKLQLVSDLPGGSRRAVQKPQGYVATIVSGETIVENGTPTGARPGRTIRRNEVAVA